MAEKEPRNKADHLKGHRFKPGRSGNPGGRPKGAVSIVSMIKKLLREDPERARKVAENILDRAAENDAKALGFARTLLERVDGPVPTQIEGADGGPVEVVVTWPGQRPKAEEDEE